MPDFRRVTDLVDARGGAAWLTVMRGGEVLLDRRTGCGPDALFYTFSVSKPFVALAVHLLAERGMLRLDDPVAAHWPAYARGGKSDITIRHVLSHRAGVPYSTGSLLGDTVRLTDLRRSVAAAEAARPRWPAGEVVGYHVLSFGFILGELVRRVGGMPVERFIAENLLRPAGLTETTLGLPDGQASRGVPLRAVSAAEHARTLLFNRPRTRAVPVPAAALSTNGRELADFYRLLLAGGEGVLRPETIAAAREVSSDGEPDRIMGYPVRWAYGFQLGGPIGLARPTGSRADPRTFGHNGSSICNVWADPVRDLVVAYLTNTADERRRALRHLSDVSDAILEASA
ncbi:serine hydrolase [uncultured Leifsonia sp.]|uniref:serine hydrolase domain-containing protein n=1 Tax=uncultured Leifsonia sp. TaxID=340359 RepID=UPI0025E6C5DA|nr:serine hydrolase domain-containing protein [uncultured Leifsonia sp.]